MKNKEIIRRTEDFAKWYTDIVVKAELIDYSSVKGSLIMRPYGFAIWEKIQEILNIKLKATGHQNVYMPLFIPESLFEKEKNHIEGFAPEVAWVTAGGNKKLEERLCVRPTSETLFCDHYSKIVRSHRDLPKLYNQWCSVVRWEKTTRPFLRSREFLWQEGHTVHATEIEAREETIRILDIYEEFIEKYLAIPVIKGRKSDKEKFSGALETYTVESLMYNGVALQSGTSHYFGQNFSKPFNIQFTNKDNKLEYAYQTSWGVSTRLIGGIIMVHGDDNGLVIPPLIAPIKVVIIPIGKSEEVKKESLKISKSLDEVNIDNYIDHSDKSPGFKFAEAELKGIPIRIEIGPRDLSENQCVLVRRDNNEKTSAALDNLVNTINNLLIDIQTNMFERARKRLNEMTYSASTLEEMKTIFNDKLGLVKTNWCMNKECEDKVKDEIGATSRCIPIEENNANGKCAICGEDGKTIVYWGMQY